MPRLDIGIDEGFFIDYHGCFVVFDVGDNVIYRLGPDDYAIKDNGLILVLTDEEWVVLDDPWVVTEDGHCHSLDERGNITASFPPERFCVQHGQLLVRESGE